MFPSWLNLAAVFLISNVLFAIFDEMAYFLTVVTMKLILVRSSTSYSGVSNIRAGMKSTFSMIDEFCLTSPVVLISIQMILGFWEELWFDIPSF